MSKILNATCVGGVVKVGEIIIPGAVILSQGALSSVGILVLDEDMATYVASNATDLKGVIEDVASMVQSIVSVLTTLDTAVTMGANAASIASITTAKTTFLAKKDNLK